MECPDSRSIGAVKAKGVPRGEGHEAREPKPMPGGQIVSPTIKSIHDVRICGILPPAICTRVEVIQRSSNVRSLDP